MEGVGQKKNKGKQGSSHDRGETVEETYREEENYEDNGDADKEEANANPFMQSIINEIRALRSDLKNEMSEFRLSFRDDMKKELNEFRGEINKKLQKATGELQATTARVAEAEQRISDIEEWDIAAKEALTQALENQEVLQAKITELEARSRRTERAQSQRDPFPNATSS